MSKAAIAVTVLFGVILTGVVIYFRKSIAQFISYLFNILKTGYVPSAPAKETAKATEA